MTKEQWYEKIVDNCKSAGTYQEHFESVIDTLSQILETRDLIHKQWVKEGKKATVIHVNKAGEANSTKNPLLTLESDLNTQALAYWRDLGLSPAGLRKLKADVVVTKDQGSFAQLLSNFDG